MPSPSVVKKYVAFCDILGFSNRTIERFDETLQIYQHFGEMLKESPVPDVDLSMYSDAILLTSDALPRILAAAQILWFFALQHNLMIRGGIAHGNYWELVQGKSLLVVSDALVRAVKLEKSVSVPAIVLADDIDIPEAYWVERFRIGVTGTPLLHFRDRNIVNPFSSFWLRSAGGRAEMLMEESPAYKDKYLWFLALHKSVWEDEPLVPGQILSSLIEKGVLASRDGGSSGKLNLSNKESC